MHLEYQISTLYHMFQTRFQICSELREAMSAVIRTCIAISEGRSASFAHWMSRKASEPARYEQRTSPWSMKVVIEC